MKKRVLFLCLIMTALMWFSGCSTVFTRYETYMRMNPDGTVDIRVLEGQKPKETSDIKQTQTLEERKESLTKSYERMADASRQEGYDCRFFENGDDFIGVVLTAEGVEPEDLADVRMQLRKLGFRNPLIKSFAIDVRGRHVLFGSRPSQKTSRYLRPGDPGSLDSLPLHREQFDLLVLELPVQPKAHNAPYVSEDGKTLAWDMTRMKNRGVFKYNAAVYDHVYAEFDLPLSPLSIGLLIAVSVILAAAMIRLFLQCRRLAAPSSSADVPPEDGDAQPRGETPGTDGEVPPPDDGSARDGVAPTDADLPPEPPARPTGPEADVS